jgi:ABC-type nitrate/sulfonate/bicarbonate transport system substrate-binding protein
MLTVAACASVVLTGACGSSSGPGAAAGSADGSAGTSEISVVTFPSFNALGAHTAEHDNVFKAEGLNAKLATVATPAEAMPQLMGGKAQFALMDMTVPTVAKAKGVPLVVVAPGAIGTAPTDGMGTGNFWVRADSKIKSIKDIENATFGVPQINSQIWVDIQAAVDDAGGDSSKIKFVEVPNTLSALKAGNVDVVTTAEPAGTAALADKRIKLLSGYTPAGGDMAYAYVTTQQFAQQNPSTVKAFQAAIIKANKAVNADPAKRAEIAGTYIKADKALLKKARYAKFGEVPVSEASVETAIDRLVKYGLLTKDNAPKPADLLISDK